MIIDSHQHFWNYDPNRDTWIDESMEVLKKNFLPRDLEPILNENGVYGCVAVQADQSEAETDFLLNCATSYPFIKGVVGWVDLCDKNVEIKLKEYAANSIFKGVRHIVQAEKRNYLLQKEVQRGIGKLSQFNLTYDLLITPEQLPSTIKLVKNFPKQKFVLDHIAKPNISKPIEKKWLSDIIKLSKNKNVWCKLSGMVTETREYSFVESDFVPFIDVIFNYFGSDRIMFGSDWPVCILASEYNNVLDIVKNYLKDHDSNIRFKILGENAKSFYNL